MDIDNMSIPGLVIRSWFIFCNYYAQIECRMKGTLKIANMNIAHKYDEDVVIVVVNSSHHSSS